MDPTTGPGEDRSLHGAGPSFLPSANLTYLDVFNFSSWWWIFLFDTAADQRRAKGCVIGHRRGGGDG